MSCSSYLHHPLLPLDISMDSSPVLCKQSQNKICSDLQRMRNEHNKMTANPKPFKLQSAPHPSKKDSENQDPRVSEIGKKTSLRPGVSRLPVLAKSLHLQTPSDFSQSHCRWEEKPLAGKAKKNKPCTRPVPFNLSQPKSSRTTNENQQPLQSQTGSNAVQPENNISNARLKAQSINTKPSKHLAVESSTGVSTRGTLKSHGKNTDNTIHASGQSGPRNTSKPSTPLSNPHLSSIRKNSMQHKSIPFSAQPSVSAENCFTNTEPLRVKDLTKTSNASQNKQLTREGHFSKGSTNKGETFQPDHAALLSFLRNEGVSAIGLGSGTPQSKPYNYLPQRVSVMKSQQKAGCVAGSGKSVQFSPDAVSLQSILQNEGVKAAGPVGATPKNSACPSGRGTSIYTAQRVPVRKNRAEPTAGTAVAVKDTPLNKWTPQRVQDTRHQPMSAMKWHLSTQQSPYVGTAGLRSCKTNLQPNQEEVVQRLFDDQEDEQSTNVRDKDPETQAEQLPAPNSTITTHCEENVETSKASTSEDEEKEQTFERRQPFIQAPERESVIFFSTGKKLLRAPRFEKQESSSHQGQHGAVSSEQNLQGSKVPEEISPVAEATCQMIPSVQSLHRDVILQKTCAMSPAVALLRKRLPPLEELRMDEEVATYTSVSVSDAHGFLPPRPRCGNPLATILHLEESTTFVPIGFDLSSGPSSGPSSPLSSTLQER
ncbi:uncharacterized protein troap isoform X2 [Anabas testudineus]|nr:uncharacterized protein troap isoform X2 [Anabas testudineus]